MINNPRRTQGPLRVTDISVHIPVFLIFNNNKTDNAEDKYYDITNSIITAKRILSFKKYITNQNWDNNLCLK